MIRVTRELDYLSAYIRLREPSKSESKAEKEVDSEECHSVAEVDLPNAKKKDVDARQWIVGLWARQRHSTTEVGLPWSHRSLALMEGERWS
ncbi:hypothetical protein GW17_00058999 [Ensete ventricosum]|nr:hypothetical protein GW17_00058999 [Ensete ventricosum]RZS09300.1 hypothetical protein BHM03_00040371 [Ensete ventricosum]